MVKYKAMKDLLKASGQFLRELDTVKHYREIADLPATYTHALNLLKGFHIEEYDYPEDIMVHFDFLCDACEQLEKWLKLWKNSVFRRESLYWEEKWKLILKWWKTPICELNEEEIRALNKEREEYIYADIEDIKYLNDKYLWRLYCLLEEIGICKAERAAELKDCECPYFYDPQEEELRELEEMRMDHLEECNPPVEVLAELREAEDNKRLNEEEDRWEAFFANIIL